MKRPTIHPTLRLLLLSATVLACLVEAAWYADRDNTMIHAKDEVGKALVGVGSRSGNSIGVEVYCPKHSNKSVVLTSAHGVLDAPEKALKEQRKPRSPNNNFGYAAKMPYSASIYSKASKNAQFHSPRIGNGRAWSDSTTDYAFIVLDKKLDKKVEGIKILKASSKALVQASKSGVLKVYLYRAETQYKEKKDGTPDFPADPKDWKKKIKKNFDSYIYDKPLRVKEPCRIDSFQDRTASDCPQEKGVSGSLYASKVGGQVYIAGVAIRGTDDEYKKSDNLDYGSTFLNSTSFCPDYEKLCGTTCIDIKDVLPPEKANKTNTATDVED